MAGHAPTTHRWLTQYIYSPMRIKIMYSIIPMVITLYTSAFNVSISPTYKNMHAQNSLTHTVKIISAVTR